MAEDKNLLDVENPEDVLRVAGDVLEFIHQRTSKADEAFAILEAAKAALVPYKGSWA